MLIKIKLSRAASMADQPRINRDPNAVNRGRVLSYLTQFCTENRQSMAYVTIIHDPIGSMYGIYTNIWGILMVNVTIYSSTMAGKLGLK